MGNFSRDPDLRQVDAEAKHYVGCRVQQGVPVLDADLHLLDGLHRGELESVGRWMLGSGVPVGSDAFRVVALAGGGLNTIVLRANTIGTALSRLEIDLTASTAAAALGFGPGNAAATRFGNSPAQLTSTKAQPFPLVAGTTLAVSVDGGAAQTVTFEAGDFTDIGAATAAEIVAAIAGAGVAFTASAGAGNDVFLTGGDGTTAGAGRILVDGRMTLIERGLRFTDQLLYENTALGTAWGVDSVDAIPTSVTDEALTVFLDVWHREVGHAEDAELVDGRIGIETAVGLRREWAVRATPSAGYPALAAARPAGHAYYPLASALRRTGDTSIRPDDLTDLRRTDLTLAVGEGSLRVYGTSGALQYDLDDFVALCSAAFTAYSDLLYSDLFLAENFATPTAAETLVLLDAFQDVKAQFRMGEEAALRRQMGVAGALAFLEVAQHMQARFYDRIYPLSSALTARVVTTNFLDDLDDLVDDLGEVVASGGVRAAIDAQLAINDFIGGRASVLPRGRLTIVFVEGPPGAVPIVAPGTYRFVYEITSEVNMQETFDLDAHVDGAASWVAALPATLALDTGDTETVNVDVTIPAATPDSVGTVVLRARSQLNPGRVEEVNNEVDITLNALPPAPVPLVLDLISPDNVNLAEDILPVGRGAPTGEPGKRRAFVFDIQNTSDSSTPQAFTMSFAFATAGKFEAIPDRALQITGAGAAAEQESVVVEATMSSTNGDRADLTVTVTRDDDPSVVQTMVIMLEVQKS